MTLRVDIRPYFTKIANYYWNEKPIPATHESIWDWLKRDYNIIKIGSMGSRPELWVSFPDDQTKTLFLLRWS